MPILFYALICPNKSEKSKKANMQGHLHISKIPTFLFQKSLQPSLRWCQLKIIHFYELLKRNKSNFNHATLLKVLIEFNMYNFFFHSMLVFMSILNNKNCSVLINKFCSWGKEV